MSELEQLTKCPVCDSEDIRSWLTVNGFHTGEYYICEECGVAFLNPRMTDDDLQAFYRSGEYRTQTEAQDANSEAAHLQHSKRAQFISGILGKYKATSHLDIGCSSGELMRTLAEEHPDITRSLGVDIDPVLTAGDCDVVHSLDEVTGEWDLITIMHTLEHINDPGGLLKKVYSLLKSNGILMVEVPNRRAWMVAFTPPQHVIAFDENSLKMCMSDFHLVKTVLHGVPEGSPLDLNILQLATK